MAKVFFICGFIGSGKTTYAKKLADKVGAFRFSIDEWVLPLFGENISREDLDQYSSNLSELFKTAALDLLKLNVNVIFDNGFWKRSERQALKLWAQERSIDYQFIYLDVPFEVCCDRALLRNDSNDKDNYFFTQEMLLELWNMFEAPNEFESIRFEYSN